MNNIPHFDSDDDEDFTPPSRPPPRPPASTFSSGSQPIIQQQTEKSKEDEEGPPNRSPPKAPETKARNDSITSSDSSSESSDDNSSNTDSSSSESDSEEDYPSTPTTKSQLITKSGSSDGEKKVRPLSIIQKISISNDNEENTEDISEIVLLPKKNATSTTKPNGVVKEGFMTKKGHNRKNWKLRWFRLTPERIAYYTSPNAKDEKGSISLVNRHDIQLIKAHGMEFKSKKREHCFKILVKSTGKDLIIDAQSGPEVNAWMRVLQQVLDGKYS